MLSIDNRTWLLHEAERKLETTEADLVQVRSDYQTVVEQCEAIRTERDRALGELAEANKLVDQLYADARHCPVCNERDELQREVGRLKTELATMRGENLNPGGDAFHWKRQLEERIARLIGEIKDLNAIIVHDAPIAEDLKRQLAEARAANDRLQRWCTQLETQQDWFGHVVGERDEARAETELLKREIGCLKTRAVMQSGENGLHVWVYGDHPDKTDRLEAQLSEALAEVEHLKARLAECQAETKDCERAYWTIEADNRRLQQEVFRLKTPNLPLAHLHILAAGLVAGD